MATFEGYERRIDKINAALAQYGIESLEAADALLKDKGIDVRSIVLGIQPIAFENAVWAYTMGAAIAVKKGVKTAADAAEAIGEMKKRGCKHIKLMVLVAAPEGIEHIQKLYPDVDIYAGALDDHLNEHGYIVPGLGDAGDRIFGTK